MCGIGIQIAVQLQQAESELTRAFEENEVQATNLKKELEEVMLIILLYCCLVQLPKE